MRLEVSSEEVRAANDIVIKKENQLPARRGNPGIPGSAGAAVRLLEDAQRTGWTKRAERLSGAVGRSVDNDDHFVFIGREVLVENRRQSS